MKLITSDLMKLSLSDLNDLNDAALRKIVSTMRSTARKRYERLQDEGLENMVKTYFKKGAASEENLLPTVKGMDRVTLINEFQRYRRFLSAKSSTVRSARKVLQQQKEFIREVSDREMDTDDMLRFFALYEGAKKTGVGGVLNYRVVEYYTEKIFQDNKDKSNKEILDDIEKRLKEVYEKEFGSPYSGTSGFFE